MKPQEFPVQVALLVFRLSIFSFFCVFLISFESLLGWAGLLLSILAIGCCNYEKLIPACHGFASGIWFGFGIGLIANGQYWLSFLLIAISMSEFVLAWFKSKQTEDLSWT